jgi:transposase
VFEVMVAAWQGSLVEVEVVEPPLGEPRVSAGLAGTKTFRAYDQRQTFLMPPALTDWLPEGHLARTVDALVEDTLDLSPILVSYVGERGFPPFDPRLMLKVLIYGYATGVTSSRKLARACEHDVAMRFLAANQTPDHRSIAKFRKRHLAAFKELFVQVLQIAARAGLVSLGRVALDGSKVRANASRHKAMSYARMGPRERQLADEVEQLRAQAAALIADAEAADAAEDEKFGDARGDELPAELASKETRLATLRAAKQALEDEAAEAAAEHAKAKAARKARRQAERDAARDGADEDQIATAGDAAEAAAAVDPDVAASAEAAAAAAVPKDKAQRNFTDPDSKIMKTSDRSFHQCYNAQAIVDETHQIIVACELNNQAADTPALPGMLDQLQANCGRLPDQLLADAGYFSEDNVARCVEVGVDALIATGRFRHNEPSPPAPRGAIPKNATVKQRMARKLATKPGRAGYARRKAIVEPVFGQMQTRQNAGQLRLRGLEAAQGEYQLHALVHNILKLFTAGNDPAPATG